MTDTYEDIINLPHHVSKTHPAMSLADRGALFAPFAALTGHRDVIDETAQQYADGVDADLFSPFDDEMVSVDMTDN